MVVAFTTTCEMSAYYHWNCEFECCSWQGDLRQVSDFLWVLRFPPTIYNWNIVEVVLNTINQTWIILISYKLKCLRLGLWFHTDWKSSKLSNVFFVFVCKFSNFLLLHTQYCIISTLKKNTLYMHVHCCEI